MKAFFFSGYSLVWRIYNQGNLALFWVHLWNGKGKGKKWLDNIVETIPSILFLTFQYLGLLL